MFRRKAYHELQTWRNSEKRKALLVTGARQVGKSYLVRHLGTTEYQSFIEINLIENSAAREALAGARDARDLITRVSLFTDNQMIEGSTLVFVDEIQELPDIMTMAKFLVDDGRFDYVFSGSMLGTEFKHVRSYPVGSVTEVEMYPMDFEEFCWAVGASEDALDQVRKACQTLTPLPEFLHEALQSYFRTYIVVGGMPEAVERFVLSQGDLAAVRSFLSGLVTSYEYDISKYAGSRALNVKAVFEQLPLQLDSDSRRFVLNSIDDNARFQTYRQDFVWLVSAGVALKTDLVREPKSPLCTTNRPGNFKLYESDTGMLVSRYPQSVARDVYLDAKGSNLGGVFENVMAQQLTAMGYDLFYHMSKKRGEVDFLIENGEGVVVPIEVKSGRSPRAHAALDNLLENSEYDLCQGIVLSRLNIETAGKVVYLPWYAIFCLDEVIEKREDSIIAALPRI